MLQIPNYILVGDMIEDSILILKEKTLVIDVNPVKPDSLSDSYRLVNKFHISISFYLAISSPAIPDTKLINEIISFFFLGNYKKTNGAPVILIFIEPSQSREELITNLRIGANAQGFVNLEVLFAEGKKKKVITVLNSTDTEKIAVAARQQLNLLTTDISDLYIRVTSKEDINMIDQYLQNEENVFRNQKKDVFIMKEQNKELRENFERAKLLTDAMQEEIQILTSHIDILRSASQATLLQNYYNSEYEILPKWYKQVGHIIKVVIGKRTFKSLFTKNIKKYKD